MYVFTTCMQYPWSQKMASDPMELEFNLGPLEEQPMLSTTELSLAPSCHSF